MLRAPQQNRAVCYSHWPSRHQAADPTCRLQNKQLERRNKLKTKTSKEKKHTFAVVAVLGRPEAVRQNHVVFSSLLFCREETSLIPISRFLPWFCVSNMIRSRRVPSVRVPFFPFPPCSTGVMRCEDTPRMSSEPSAPLNPSDRDTGLAVVLYVGLCFCRKPSPLEANVKSCGLQTQSRHSISQGSTS